MGCDACEFVEYFGEIAAFQTYVIHNVLDGDGVNVVAFDVGFCFSNVLKEDGLTLFLVIAGETVGLGNVGEDGVHEGLDGEVVAEAYGGQVLRQGTDIFIYGVLGVKLAYRGAVGKPQLVCEGVGVFSDKSKPAKMQRVFRGGVVADKLRRIYDKEFSLPNGIGVPLTDVASLALGNVVYQVFGTGVGRHAEIGCAFFISAVS